MSEKGSNHYRVQQENVAEFIRALECKLKELQKSQRAVGWAQRNSVIKHVYSNYREHQNVLEKRNKWEYITLECNVIKGLLKILLPHRNIYGFFDISKMKQEFDALLQIAEKKDEFELADSINVYRKRFIEFI